MTEKITLFDEEAASQYLGGASSPISPRTLQRWRLEGVGPTYIKLGRLVRYRLSDLNAYLDGNASASSSMAAISGSHFLNHKEADRG